ncbi:MAG: murein transglycosylase domain-containing protein [Pseudomonadales bacterium]
MFAYRSDSSGRTLIDFESSLIVASSETISRLKQRIVEVLLTQIDPSVIDAHTAYDLGLINQKTKKLFFFNQIKDHDGESIASVWRAERFANFLIYNELRHAGDFSIVLSMVATHKQLAGAKYVHYVLESTRSHPVNPPLVMAIMETESAFNPMARSRSNALGLMQIKADTAGRDYFTRIKGYAHTPNPAYLYQPAQNIEIGSGALPVAINPIEIIAHSPTGLFFQSRSLA